MDFYKLLRDHFGFQNWWPGESPFEVMIGAILTQNTSWPNVEKALRILKRGGLLDPKKLRDMEKSRLSEYIRPSGYYNQKALKVKAFLTFYEKNFFSDVRVMKKTGKEKLRKLLLDVRGIGRETADSMLLYAASKKIFVIDGYTKRSFTRLGFFSDENIPYDEARMLFENNLPRRLELYKDYHAQIVMLGKHYCKKKKPLCEKCPLERVCEKKSIVNGR